MFYSNALKNVIGLILILVSIGSAEFKPSMYLGWTNGPSWLYYHNKSDDESALVLKIENFSKYAWELYAGVHLTGHFGLQSGVLFNKSTTMYFPTPATSYMAYTLKMNYVNIPMLLTLSTQRDDKFGYVSFAAGPMLCIVSDVNAFSGENDLGDEVKNKYHKSTIDLMTKAEMKFRITVFLLNLGIRYQQGFVDIENKAATDSQGNKVWKSTTLLDPANYAPRATTIRNGWGLIFGIELAPLSKSRP